MAQSSSDPNFNATQVSISGGDNLMSSAGGQPGGNTQQLGFNPPVQQPTDYINCDGLQLGGNDDLLQFLQTGGDRFSPRDDFDNFEEELDFPYHIIDSAPSSTCTSACSSAATSPVPYNIYNTPPVTPQPDRQRSPTFLALEPQQVIPPISNGANHFDSSLNPGNDSYLRSRLTMDPTLSDRTVTIKQDPELLEQMPPTFTSLPGEVKQQRPLSLTTQVKNEGAGRVKRSLQQQPGDGQPQSKKPRNPAKGTAEYQQKREKNNVAVRRSRDKAKQKAMETQHKVQLLTAENKKLHDRVAELTHELTTLKNLLKSLPQYQNNMNV